MDGRQHSGDVTDDAEKLFSSIGLTPIATVVTNPRLPDNPIVAANEAFTRLTGYAVEEICGRNCRFLAGPGTDATVRQSLREAIAQRRPALAELINYRKDGRPFRNALMIAPMLDEAGEVLFFVGSQMEMATPDSALETRRVEALRQVSQLSPRQRQMLECLVRGWRNKQIAGHFGIGEKTVKMHRSSMLRKLGVPTSADAIRIGVEAGFTG